MRRVHDTMMMWLVEAGDFLVDFRKGQLGIIHSGDIGHPSNPDLREVIQLKSQCKEYLKLSMLS